MKVALKYIITLLLMSTLASCYDTKDGNYTEPITVYEKINGNWKISSLKQIDEIAKAASQSLNEVTLTSQFGFSTFTIALNVDNQNRPTTFEIGGSSPAFFETEGYWKLNRDYPTTDGSTTVVELYSDAAKQVKTGELIVASTPSATQEMELKFTRTDKGIAFVSYVYKLTLIEEDHEE